MSLLSYSSLTSGATSLKPSLHFFPQTRVPLPYFSETSISPYISQKFILDSSFSFILFIFYSVTRSCKLSKYLSCLSLPNRTVVMPLPCPQIFKFPHASRQSPSSSSVASASCQGQSFPLRREPPTDSWAQPAQGCLEIPSLGCTPCITCLTPSFPWTHILAFRVQLSCNYLMKQLLTVSALHMCFLLSTFTTWFFLITHCPGLLFNSFISYV